MSRKQREEEIKAKAEDTGYKHKVFSKGEWKFVPVVRVPTELLYLNDDNRRFRTSAQAAAVELGRKLDPNSNSDDELSIMSLLLDTSQVVENGRIEGKPSADSLRLLADWQQRGQVSPFWIRPDGLVMNGNRRLAMIKRQQQTEGADFFPWVEVMVFPEDEYDDDEMFKMEAAEQLTDDQKVKYSDIENLRVLADLAEREGIDWGSDKSIRDCAVAIQGVAKSADYAEIQLNAMKYMDLFLDEIGSPGEYYLLRRKVERFRDVGKTMKLVKAEGLDDEDEVLGVLFAAVKCDNNHGDVRLLKRLWKDDPDRFRKVAKRIDKLEEEAPPEEGDEEDLSDLEEDEDLEEGGDGGMLGGETKGVAPAGYPKQKVKRALDVEVERVRDNQRPDAVARVFSAAEKLSQAPVSELADKFDDGSESDELRSAVEAIAAWVDEASALINDADS